MSAIEICVERGGKWELFNAYASEDAAVEEAIGLKSQNAFPKIAVMNHETKRIAYFYDKNKGSKLQYNNVMGLLKKAAASPLRSGAVRREKIEQETSSVRDVLARTHDSDSQQKKSVENSQRLKVIAVVLGGISMSVFLLFATEFDPMGMFMSLALVLLCGYYGYLMQTPDEDDSAEASNEVDEESSEEVSDDHLIQVSHVFSTIVQRAKEVCWDSAELKMKGDSHFGLMLYMVGAMQAFSLVDQKKIELYFPVLNHALQSIGLDEQSILRCCQNIEEFRLNPRFSNMFERGLTNTQSHLQNPENNLGIRRAMELWVGMEGQEDGEAEVEAAVLFTDIVSFTEQTAQKGDAWLTNVVLAHNKIVRDILKTYEGREVKHTGDGIMSSFPSSVSAVNAAVHMQRGFEYFSQKKSALAFEVRIGICTGNPVQMDGDLFGNPVNMAARVMDFGDPQDIILAQSTYDIYQEEGTADYDFDEISDVQLKGFEGEHSVYKVLWQQEKKKEEGGDEPSDDVPVTSMDPESLSAS